MLPVYIYLLVYYLRFLYGYRAVDAVLIFSQTWHETGGFTSNLCKTNKNLFGMMPAKVRKNLQAGEASGFANYSTYYNSVSDYFLRQQNFKIAPNNETYVNDTVLSGYAEDLSYSEKWVNIYNTIKTGENTILKRVRLAVYLVFAFLMITIFYFYLFSKHVKSAKYKF